jgi:uncharacterized NAD-dependent epimerase/dehydratase family protein
VLDGRENGIPILASLGEAIAAANANGLQVDCLVIGLAPDGGRLPLEARKDICRAIEAGINIDSGLHDFLCEDQEISTLALRNGVQIRDVRKPPPRNRLHFFSGKIEDVDSLKVAILGTDSAVGKRTTAWILVKALQEAGHTADLVGTGQTAWLQGARYSIILDSLINDFVSGEIEHAVWKCWHEQSPDVILIEGQGSLLNPAYPGGLELIAAARPDCIVLQYAPARKEYDGFPGYAMHPLTRQIEVVEMISDRPIVAVTINHEGLQLNEIPEVCSTLEEQFNLPVVDVLVQGGDRLVQPLVPFLHRR